MRYQRYSLVKCPILCLNLLLFSDNFFSPRVVLFLIKTTKNDLEKKHAVPGAHRHIRLSLSLFLYSFDIQRISCDSMRSTHRGLDGRVLS